MNLKQLRLQAKSLGLIRYSKLLQILAKRERQRQEANRIRGKKNVTSSSDRRIAKTLSLARKLTTTEIIDD